MDTILVQVAPSLPRTKISYELAPLQPTTVLVHLPTFLPSPKFLGEAERKLSVLVCTLLDLLQGPETYTTTRNAPVPARFGSSFTPRSSHKSLSAHPVPMVPARFPGAYSAYSAYIPLAAY